MASGVYFSCVIARSREEAGVRRFPALAAAQPDPILGDLATGSLAGAPVLGDLRLDLTTTDAGTAALTVGDLLALLAAAQPDVLLGDLRLDLATDAPALTIAEFVATLQAVGGGALPDVLLGDLRLDLATGVDALVIDAITAFLLDPETFAPYLLGALNTWTDATAAGTVWYMLEDVSLDGTTTQHEPVSVTPAGSGSFTVTASASDVPVLVIVTT